MLGCKFFRTLNNATLPKSIKQRTKLILALFGTNFIGWYTSEAILNVVKICSYSGTQNINCCSLEIPNNVRVFNEKSVNLMI